MPLLGTGWVPLVPQSVDRLPGTPALSSSPEQEMQVRERERRRSREVREREGRGSEGRREGREEVDREAIILLH